MTSGRWTAKQRRYQEILADPGEKRTQEEIAGELGVKRQTLWNWRQLEGFWAELHRLVKDRTNQAIARVWDALMRQCKRGDVQAMRLYFQLRGELTEQVKDLTERGPLEVEIRIDGEPDA